MATTSHPHSHRPLLDPDQFEQAGRRFRQWLNGLATPEPKSAERVADDIAWEDGEPHKDHRPDAADRR
jgi:hypothetical protein